jgi:Flp pilus assembly protein TadD
MAAETAALFENWREAELLLYRCLQIAPDLPDLVYRHACFVFAQGDHSRAAERVRACGAERQARADAGALMAACLVRTGLPEQAVTLSSALVARAPWHARLWILHGQILHEIGRAEEAKHAFRRAEDLRPGIALTWE